MQMAKYPKFVVNNTKNCKKIIQTLFGAAQKGHDPQAAVGMDCEGVNLGDIKTGYVTLVQLSTWKEHVYIFDVLHNPDLFTEGSLRELLESSLITKVMHSCGGDVRALRSQYGITVNGIFDTQAVYAELNKETKGQQISYNNLCKEYNVEVNKTKDEIKKIYRYNPKFWSDRPLTSKMLNYASEDVISLLPIMHKQLADLADKKLREESPER